MVKQPKIGDIVRLNHMWSDSYAGVKKGEIAVVTKVNAEEQFGFWVNQKYEWECAEVYWDLVSPVSKLTKLLYE
jgi:hypothetical protein